MLIPWLRYFNTDYTLNNCFFGPVKLTKNAGQDKYKYSSYCIEFGSHSEFSFRDRRLEEYFIIFGADTSLSVHIDNKNKDKLIIDEGLDDNTLTAEAK